MSKLSQQDEKELISFIKDWLRAHGYTQKDLANELKIKELYKKGGIFNIAKNLIKIEQNWLNDIQKDPQELNQTQPYNQLDIDSLVNQINKDSNQ